ANLRIIQTIVLDRLGNEPRKSGFRHLTGHPLTESIRGAGKYSRSQSVRGLQDDPLPRFVFEEQHADLGLHHRGHLLDNAFENLVPIELRVDDAARFRESAHALELLILFPHQTCVLHRHAEITGGDLHGIDAVVAEAALQQAERIGGRLSVVIIRALVHGAKHAVHLITKADRNADIMLYAARGDVPQVFLRIFRVDSQVLQVRRGDVGDVDGPLLRPYGAGQTLTFQIGFIEFRLRSSAAVFGDLVDPAGALVEIEDGDDLRRHDFGDLTGHDPINAVQYVAALQFLGDFAEHAGDALIVLVDGQPFDL